MNLIKKFWKTGKEKRQEFLDKLKGELSFHIKENAPIGAEFMLSNKSAGSIESYIYSGNDTWVCFGTGNRIGGELVDRFTRRQLEMHLTRLVREADWENSIRIMDEGHYLTWVKPQ